MTGFVSWRKKQARKGIWWAGYNQIF